MLSALPTLNSHFPVVINDPPSIGEGKCGDLNQLFRMSIPNLHCRVRGATVWTHSEMYLSQKKKKKILHWVLSLHMPLSWLLGHTVTLWVSGKYWQFWASVQQFPWSLTPWKNWLESENWQRGMTFCFFHMCFFVRNCDLLFFSGTGLHFADCSDCCLNSALH